MRPSEIALVATGLILLSAAPATGHAFLRRYDLPLPLWHYLIGAGSVVLLSFLLMTIDRLGRSVALAPGIDLSRTALQRLVTMRWPRQALSLCSVVFLIFLIGAGLFGAQHDPFKNILPVFVWVIWWVGLAFVCAAVGNLWPIVNPWAAVGYALERASGQRTNRPLPCALGVWPAVVLYVGFAWAELVWPENAHPASLATAILIYSAITWVAMARYGTDRWLRRGETFTLLFGLFGRFAPLGCDAQGRLKLRLYGAGLLGNDKRPPGMLVFVVALLATVSFDGFLHTPLWRKIFSEAFSLSYDLGLVGLLGNNSIRTLILSAALFAAPLVFFTVFIATCAWTAALMGGARSKRQRPREVAHLYALTLVPIAIAYHFAHYLSLLLIEGQRLVALVSDPLGLGWNLFGTAAMVPDIGVVDARFLWLFSVAAIVAGHIIAVVLAHIITLQVCHDRGRSLSSQIPMLILMVGYTMLSLWIVAQPIVET